MRFVKWVSVFGALLVVVFCAFSVYANLLLDYSLENLVGALSATDKSLALKSPVVKNLYKNLVYNIALEETTLEDADIKEVVLLGLASRSMEENIERAGYERASIYLNRVTEVKNQNRSNLLLFTDRIYHYTQTFYETMMSVIRYFQVRILGLSKKEKKLDYQDVALLSDAEKAQNRGDYSKAIRLYKQYLAIYPRRPEHGFVSLSLAHIFMRQQNYSEALKILGRVQRNYVGKNEYQLAASFIKRVKSMQTRDKAIKKYKEQIRNTEQGSFVRMKLELKLALAYLASYQFKTAEKILVRLKDVSDKNINTKSRFYLSRIYKEYKQYDKAIRLMEGLLQEKDLSEELRLSLQAELADQYYRNKEPEKAVQSYEILGEEVGRKFTALDAALEATKSLAEIRKIKLYSDWAAVAEIEQANIYLFDFGNSAKAEDKIRGLDNRDYGSFSMKNLNKGLRESSRLSLRDRAFKALKSGEVHAAYEMFQRNIKIFSRDGWSYAGLSTTYLLLANLKEAEVNALKGIRFTPDEYTISVLAYVQGSKGDFNQSIKNYESAILKRKDYAPALYNLGCMYLETGQFAKAYDIFERLKGQLDAGQGFMESKVLNNMGYAIWKLGNTEESRDYFEQALKVTPTFVLAAKNLRKLAIGEHPGMFALRGEI